MNANAHTVAHDVFQVCNQGTQLVECWIADDPDWPTYDGKRRVDFYLGDDPDRSIIGEDNSVTLDCGKCICVGIEIRTHEFEGEHVLAALDDEIVLTAEAAGECGSGENPEPDPDPTPCPDGALVAKYEWEDCEFVFEKGTGGPDTVAFDNLTYKEECEPIAFDWQSSTDMGSVTVFAGGQTATFDGGRSGTVDLEAAGLTNAGGNTPAISNVRFCPDPDPDPLPVECPEGTTRLATYEWDGDAYVYAGGNDGHPDWDDHTGQEAIDVTVVETNADGEPIAVEWESTVGGQQATYVHGVTAAGTDAKQSFDGAAGSGFGGTIDFGETGITDDEGDTETIDRIGFCAGVCWQVDLVEGDAEPCLDSDNQYSHDDALIAFRHGSTAEDDNSSKGSDEPGIVAGSPPAIEFDYDAGEARVSFTVGQISGSRDVTLAVHYAICPPGVQDLGRQLLWDETQTTVSSSDEVTLTADLPSDPAEDLVVRSVDRDCE